MAPELITYLDEWKKTHPRPRRGGWSLQFTARKRDPVTGERGRWRHTGFDSREEAEAAAERLRRPHRVSYPFPPATKARLERGMRGKVRIEIVPPPRGWK